MTGSAVDAGRRKLLLIDGNSVLYRAFYGLPLLSNSQGLYTNAVYGFAMMTLHLLRMERPTHVAVAFDKGKTTFRHEEYAEYKGKRQETPPELVGQFSMARELLDSFRIPYLELERYEADDILGTLAHRAGGFEVVLVSGDKDLLQLVAPGVTVCLTKKGTTDLVRYDSAAVRERYGLDPAQIVDLKGLMGDTSDNIPGVPGIGEKTGIKLLVEFGSMEAVLDQVDKVSGKKLQERLREYREQAVLSKRLALIRRDVPLGLGPEDLHYTGYELGEVRTRFRDYDFRTLIARLEPWPGAGNETDPGAGNETEIETEIETESEAGIKARTKNPDGAGGSKIPASASAAGVHPNRGGSPDLSHPGAGGGWTGKPSTADTSPPKGEPGVDEWLEGLLREGGPVAVIPDLAGDYHTGEWRGVALAHAGGALYVPAGPAAGAARPEVSGGAGLLRRILDDRALRKVVYDAKALVVRLAEGWPDEGEDGGAAETAGDGRPEFPADLRVKRMESIFDTLLATYLIHASEGEPSLLDVLERALPELQISDAVRLAVEKGGSGRPEAMRFCAEHLLSAAGELQNRLIEMDLMRLYEDLELPLAYVLADMEAYGVRLDVSRLAEIGAELQAGIRSLTSVIYEEAGIEFNINSPKQLGEILFDKMGLPTAKKTKTGYSTSAEVLERLAPYSPFVSHILEYRQLAKLQSTYVEGLLKVARPPHSRVHTSFRQAMTATGRLSSADPNLQNIPVRLEEGRRLRQAFVPTWPDWRILSADYSQVELRILAHLSQDAGMIAAFAAGDDIHTRTAGEVFEVAPDEVTPSMRRQAKAVNFGIVYGISDYGLSQNLNITRQQAAAFIERYFAKFPGVQAYMRQSVEEARKRGYAETLLGRRRYLPQILSRNFNERSFAERTAMNTPIQGTAADIIKLAMVQIDAHLRENVWKSRMLLQVHDELIFEYPPEEGERLTEVVRAAMEKAVRMDVPLQVDIHSGQTWYDAK